MFSIQPNKIAPKRQTNFVSFGGTTAKVVKKKSTNTIKKAVPPDYFTRKAINVSSNDIVNIHAEIKSSFNDSSRNKIINSKYKQLSDMKSRVKINSKITHKHIYSMRNEILNIEMEYSKLLYTIIGDSYLEKYKELKRDIKVDTFGSETTEHDTIIQKGLDMVVRDFLSSVRYFAIFEDFNINKTVECEVCGGTSFTQCVEDESLFVCNDCFTETHHLDDTPTYKDSNRVNMSTKYTYTKRNHFSDAIKRYQGIQSIDVEKIDTVVAYIEQQMQLHKITKTQGKSNSLTKNHVYMFLAESKKFAKHYNDINLLFFKLTGVQCPDISHLEDQLYEDFELQEAVYEEYENTCGRTNSLNVDYKLCRLLIRRGWQCTLDEFFILKTREKEEEHDDILKIVWARLGWGWIK